MTFRTKLSLAIIGVVAYIALLQVCLGNGVTTNVLWAPTTARRAVWLAITVAPLLLSAGLLINMALTADRQHRR